MAKKKAAKKTLRKKVAKKAPKKTVKKTSKPAVTSKGPKKLYRSKTDRILGGVAGGLGEYWGIDSAWIRLAFVLLVLFHGLGILIYLVLWVIVPSR